MMVALSPTSSTAADQSWSFSSSVRVGDSPVVAATTSPSAPVSITCRASARNRSESTAPSLSNGVTIAVRTSPSKTSILLGCGPLEALVELGALARAFLPGKCRRNLVSASQQLDLRAGQRFLRDVLVAHAKLDSFIEVLAEVEHEHPVPRKARHERPCEPVRDDASIVVCDAQLVRFRVDDSAE